MDHQVASCPLFPSLIHTRYLPFPFAREDDEGKEKKKTRWTNIYRMIKILYRHRLNINVQCDLTFEIEFIRKIRLLNLTF